jgi:uncharacterized phosphosugar-binding protein
MSTLSGALQYIQIVQDKLKRIVETQMDNIDQAAECVAKTIQADGMVYLFGTGHSHMLSEEGHYRAGGLVQVCPILSTSLMLHEGAVLSTELERTRGIADPLLAQYQPSPDDTIIIFSNSGVNAVPVEMSLAAKEKGMSVIAIVALDYADTIEPKIDGKKLADVADIVLNNQGEPGDGVVPIHPSGVKAGPTSTVTGAFILNAIFVEAIMRIASDSEKPPVYISANVPGAAEHNADLLERYRSRNPHL